MWSLSPLSLAVCVWNTNIPLRPMKELLSRTVHTQCAMPTHFHQYDNNSTRKRVSYNYTFHTYLSWCVCTRAQCGANSRISDNNPTETVHTSMDLIDRFFFILTFLRVLLLCLCFCTCACASLLRFQQLPYHVIVRMNINSKTKHLPLAVILVPSLFFRCFLCYVRSRYSIEIAQRVLRKQRSNRDWSFSLSLFFQSPSKRVSTTLVHWHWSKVKNRI